MPSHVRRSSAAVVGAIVSIGMVACGLSVVATGEGEGEGDAGGDVASDASLDSGRPADASTDGPSCFVAPSSMIAWWSGDGDMNDRVGGRAGVSGTQDGAIQVAFGAGKVASAFDLRGTSYVQVPNATTFQLKGTLTIEAWILATALGGRVVDKNTAGSPDGYMLDTFQSKLRMLVGRTSLSSTTNLPVGVWTHVTGTYNGTTMSIFVNGVLAASRARTGAIPTTTLPVRIGADSDGKNRFSGVIDEVVLYDRALSPPELMAIVSGGSLGRCLP